MSLITNPEVGFTKLEMADRFSKIKLFSFNLLIRVFWRSNFNLNMADPKFGANANFIYVHLQSIIWNSENLSTNSKSAVPKKTSKKFQENLLLLDSPS